MAVMMKESTIRSPGLDEQKGLALGPLDDLQRSLVVSRMEVVETALVRLWQDLGLGPDAPLIFLGSRYHHKVDHHQPRLLEMAVARGQRLEAPSYAYGIAEAPIAGPLLRANLLHEASVYDRKTHPGALSGWFRYDFAAGWSALSVMLAPDEDGEAQTVIAIPMGCQDEWLAFLRSLREMHSSLLHEKRRARIELLGESHEIEEVIRKTTFDEVILPQEILGQVASQRRIFSPETLARYAKLGIPRIRKVLLIGPPGTGKTTLLKAEAAAHMRRGGLVFYVFASHKEHRSWEQLAYALNQAAVSRLPTLILVEDFELFVSDAEDPQRVLNTLDGVEAPDNPRGTLLLATSNAPGKIDPRIKDRPGRIDLLIEIGLVEREDLVVRFLQRFLGAAYREEEHTPLAPLFLKQPGSHLREVCLLGSIHALEQGRADISRDDLRWAHETLLHGRALAAEAERFESPPARKRGPFFGNRGK